MSTEQIDVCFECGQTYGDADRLRAQRDELLEALQYAVFVMDTPSSVRDSSAHNKKSALYKARAAIAKCKDSRHE